MDIHSAKCRLLDLASYTMWRKDETLPESLSEDKVVEAVMVVWKDTFGSPMEVFDKCGMHMPLTPEEEETVREHKTCGRCYDDVDELFPSNCGEKPEALLGQPIGQYHCGGCGAMLVGGIPHPDMCKRCIDRVHPAFDFPGCPKCGSLNVGEHGCVSCNSKQQRA